MTPVSHYIYVLRPTRPEMLTSGFTDAETRIQADHSAYLDRLSEHGDLILFGRTLTTDQDTFGIVVFKAESEAAARRLMENDPGVKNGLMHAKLYPYRIAYMAKD